jgi:hypothetical protein
MVDHLGYAILKANTVAQYGASIANEDNLNQIQQSIDSPQRVTVIDGTKSDIYTISQTLQGTSNKTIVLNATLKISDGITLPLESDMLIGETSIDITNAANYFKAGDRVVIQDENRAIEGGGNGKVRKEAQPFLVDSVVGDTVNFTWAAVFDYVVSAGARIGHLQNVIGFENCSNFHLIGSGTLDGNKQNQIYAEANSRSMNNQQGHNHGTSLLTYFSNNFKIQGIEIKDACITNHFIYSCNDFIIEDVDNHDSIDKCLLIYAFTNAQRCKRGIIRNSKFRNSDFEDGISGYNNGENMLVENVEIENCGRFGIYVAGGLKQSIIRNVSVKNCGHALYITQPDCIFEGNNYIEGAGRYSKLPSTKKAAVIIFENNGGKLENMRVNLVIKDTELLRVINSSGWNFENIEFNYTDNIAVKITGVNPNTNTLVNPVFVNNNINIETDENSTLITL